MQIWLEQINIVKLKLSLVKLVAKQVKATGLKFKPVVFCF